MARLDDMKDIAMNFKECVTKDGKDLVKLRDMRNGEYTPSLNLNFFNTVDLSRVGNKKEGIQLKALCLALQLWSHHQYALGSDEYAAYFKVSSEPSEMLYYKYTFGHLLYKLSEFYSEEEWERLCSKYERSSSDINTLVRFMRLVTKEAIDRGIKVQLDYGRIAYFFSRILKNKTNTSEFLEDVMTGFYISKTH